eukprot:CAMPEP_0114117342 /NCGR_PEP_ID=MMETSP0043_2-20121206/4982_1 /TAXON_ID=464988 /ORGANISM="Hemiselmis andersenii, Strain CCMP644" /LENGTH=138 /DNA_ID=CAMNT_0001209727 /DNA_START=80 /DNA_END=496 /DNA_ORIENTATION=-
MNQKEGKKTIEQTTVLGHILQALQFGDRPIDLRRLFRELPTGTLPSRRQWNLLDEKEALLGVSVVKDSGFSSKELLKTILDSANKEHGQKTSDEVQAEREWYSRIRIWSELKKGSVPVDASDSSEGASGGDMKRARCA